MASARQDHDKGTETKHDVCAVCKVETSGTSTVCGKCLAGILSRLVVESNIRNIFSSAAQE